jgi:hypothetical protein
MSAVEARFPPLQMVANYSFRTVVLEKLSMARHGNDNRRTGVDKKKGKR